MKKLLSLLFASMLVFALTMPAFAIDSSTTSTASTAKTHKAKTPKTHKAKASKTATPASPTTN